MQEGIPPLQADGPQVQVGQLDYREENGQEVVYHNNALFTGLAYSDYQDGKRFTEQAYQNGVQSGPWRISWPTGLRQKEGRKMAGHDQGVYHEWYESGKLKYEYHYQQGQKIGVWKSWYENGQQWTERHWENNTLHGKVLVWDTDGTLTKEYVYVNGQQVSAKQNLPK